MRALRSLIIGSLAACGIALAVAQPAEVAPQPCTAEMRRAMEALDQAAARDRGALWGRGLEGAVILVDPHSRATETAVSPDGAACVRGTLPAALPVANTCLRLQGERVASLLLPLPKAGKDLTRLLVHERWHCLQDDLGLPALEGDNAHLDTRSARTWLRLELRALRAALQASERNWHSAARAAIVFRAQRNPSGVLNADVLQQEARLEANEGLAEYTGQRLSDPKGDLKGLLDRMRAADAADSHLRTFAYHTGPAYGMLLDRCDAGWTRRLGPGDDLPSLLSACLQNHTAHIAPSSDPSVLGVRYGLPAVQRDEARRARLREAHIAQLTRKFVTGHYLELPLRQPNIRFDPGTLSVLAGVGTVYQGLSLSDDWGRLDVVGVALVDQHWRFVRIPLQPHGCQLPDPKDQLTLHAPRTLGLDSEGRCHWHGDDEQSHTPATPSQ